MAPRSWLFVPGDRVKELLPKALASGADAVVVDLEDAVPAMHKLQSRSALRDATRAVGGKKPIFVRVNAVDTEWFHEDVAAALAGQAAGLVLPKTTSPADVRETVALISTLSKKAERPVSLVALLEDPVGVLAAHEIAEADPTVCALALGGEDLAAELGTQRTLGGLELLYARGHIVMAAAAAGRWSIDTPCMETRRMATVAREARMARAVGFDGMFLIHPAQVKPIHQAFDPSLAEIERAERIIAAAEAADKAGRGVALSDAQLVDRPVVRAARQLLDRAHQ